MGQVTMPAFHILQLILIGEKIFFEEFSIMLRNPTA